MLILDKLLPVDPVTCTPVPTTLEPVAKLKPVSLPALYTLTQVSS